MTDRRFRRKTVRDAPDWLLDYEAQAWVDGYNAAIDDFNERFRETLLRELQ